MSLPATIKSTLQIIFFVLFIACGKQTQVKGIVYSKHNIPMSGISVSYERYRESSYPENSYFGVTTTDANGTYQFSFKGTSRYSYHVKCFSADSGYQNKLVTTGTINSIDLHLE